jgi:hypothetical protein
MRVERAGITNQPPTQIPLDMPRSRRVSIESLSSLSDIFSDEEASACPIAVPPRRGDSYTPVPNLDAGMPTASEEGSKRHKRPLTESQRSARCERHKRQRLGQKSKQAKRERKQRKRHGIPPTERGPRCKTDHAPPGSIPACIEPLSHFPVVSTGYTGKAIEDIPEKEVWTLEKLIAMGLEVV